VVVFKAGGYEHKQTLTNNQSCQRKRDAVLHCATQLHCRQCQCSCEMALQNPVLHFPVLHLQRSPRDQVDMNVSGQDWRYLSMTASLSPPVPQHRLTALSNAALPTTPLLAADFPTSISDMRSGLRNCDVAGYKFMSAAQQCAWSAAKRNIASLWKKSYRRLWKTKN